MEKESVFLTGATGIIGSVFVENFLSKGYQVIFTTTSEKKLKNFYEQYAAFHKQGNLYGCHVDLLADDATEIIKKFLDANKLNPHYLINNARSLEFVKVDDFRKIDKEKWIGEYLLGVVVPYNLTILFSESENSRLKSVVNISSMYGMLAYNDYLCEGSKSIAINYGVVKAALIKLTSEMAVRLAPLGIRVNSISYGGVVGRADENFQKRYAKLCPAGQMLSANDIAGHALYLCSDASLGMTGHNLVVDGGFSVW